MTGPTIGVLSPLLESYYYTLVLEGVHATAAARGGRVVAVDTTLLGDRRLALADCPVNPRSVDGLLVVLDALSDDDWRRLCDRHFPLVSISRPGPDGRTPYSIADNAGGMRAAIVHLIGHGHRRIGYIGGPPDNEDARQRHEAYRATLTAAGLTPDPNLEICGDWSEAAGEQCMVGLQARSTKFTALACANDRMAFGALRVLAAHGGRVPEDLALVGFDDATLSAYQRPPLTTVRQPIYSLGTTAAGLLLDWLDGDVPPPGPAYVETDLVVRQSCGCRPLWAGEGRLA